MDDIFAIQDEIAFAIAEKLKITLLDSEKEAIETNPTTNQEAYENYLKGRYFIEKRSMLEAKRCYELAIESDPEFALAYAGLADALCLISIYGLRRSKGDLELGDHAGLKALKLNGSLAEAHAATAFVKMIYHWNWEEAEHHFLKAINLNPNSALTRQRYALYFLAMVKGDFERAKEVIRKAIALEPWNATCQFSEAIILIYEKNYQAGVLSAEKAIQLAPDSFVSYRYLGVGQFGLGQTEKAIDSLLKAMSLSNRHHFCIFDLITIYVKAGRLKEARELFNELREKSLSGDVHIDGLIGFTASILGELEIAQEYYLKAIKNRDGDLIFHPRYPFMKEFVLSADFAKQLRVEMKFPE